jgi:L-ascorbate 6-phosphate lactonase
MNKAMTLIQRIGALSLGRTFLIYLGQAGYIVRTATGKLIAVDLYLSDCVQRVDGFKRLMPYLVQPRELTLDTIVATHAHYDHFDIDSMVVLMNNNHTKLFASEMCAVEVQLLGINENNVTYVRPGDGHTSEEVEINFVPCDHGQAAPDAVGLVLTVNGVRLYFAGDTSLRIDYATEVSRRWYIDVLIAPINGHWGNLNEDEMVTLCEIIHPGLAIPSHYWCFAEHGGDPGLFQHIIASRLPGQKYQVMAQGECFELVHSKD